MITRDEETDGPRRVMIVEERGLDRDQVTEICRAL